MSAAHAVLLLFLCWAACKQSSPGPALQAGADSPASSSPSGERPEETGPHPGIPTRVRLPKEVIKEAGVQAAPVREERLAITLEMVGEVAADPDRTARVAARLPGRVAAVHVREGDRVQAGALLCVLESPELSRTRAQLLSAQARKQSAAQNAERLSGLAAAGAASRQEATQASAESQVLHAEAQAAEQTLRSWGLSGASGVTSLDGSRLLLRAPIDGFIVARNATLGQTVMQEHVLFDLINLEQAYFIGRLFEKSLARVQVGAAAEVRLNAYPDVVFVGSIESIGKQLDPTARTVTARIRIRNQGDRLKVGLFGTARVTSNEPLLPELHLTVPVSALTRIAERDVVFVQEESGEFAQHPVTLGRTASGRAEVLSGLRLGELVVVEGVYTLKSALLRRTLQEEE